jgi:hypothetical protein
MDRNQAGEFQEKAPDACDAVDRSSDVIASLSDADRSRVAPFIGAACEALAFELITPEGSRPSRGDHQPKAEPKVVELLGHAASGMKCL